MLGRENFITSTFRSFPDSIKLISFLFLLVHPSNNNLYAFLLFVASTLSNFLLKKIFMVIYKLIGKKKLPILGLGGRPEGASSCSTFLTFDDKLSKSFGMPSGHSQIAWVFASYYIFEIWNPLDYKNDKADDDMKFYDNYKEKHAVIVKTLQTALLFTFALFMSYSRVYIEKCHTFEQVTMGAIFGVAVGFLAYYLKPYILK
tara:strand:- start:1579 stop:2184 length:606 start_codon:yes stop_codon:yes gene_type:complete